MIEKLTAEQESMMSVYRDMYIDKFFKNDHHAEHGEVTEFMHELYRKFDISKNKTPEVVLLDSPIEILMAVQLVKDKKIDSLDNIEQEVRAALDRGEKYEWYYPSSYLSAFNSWISLCDFFDTGCGIIEDNESFRWFKKILDFNIFWSLPFENYVFVSRNATEFHTDGENRLHSVDRPAVYFNEYCQFYFIHGVGIQPEMFDKLANRTFTFEDFVGIQNEEVKAAVLSMMEERFGTEAMFHFISDNLQVVDEYVDKKDDTYLEGTTRGMNIGVYTLMKGSVGEVELAFVRCYCPSTDRMFYLGVEPKNTSAKDAIASLYRIPRKLSSEIKYIQRQGERFSTVLTDDGKQLLETMSKEDLTDMVAISGDRYFSMMRYEY